MLEVYVLMILLAASGVLMLNGETHIYQQVLSCF